MKNENNKTSDNQGNTSFYKRYKPARLDDYVGDTLGEKLKERIEHNGSLNVVMLEECRSSKLSYIANYLLDSMLKAYRGSISQHLSQLNRDSFSVKCLRVLDNNNNVQK